MSNDFWIQLSRLSSLIQIISVFPFLFTAYFFWRRARRYKVNLEKQKGVTTAAPYAIAIGLCGTDITGQVNKYLQSCNKSMSVESLCIKKEITPERIPNLLRELLKTKAKLTENGATEIHLFIASPVVFGVFVGALLDNWVPVKVYHNNRDTGYEFWGTLSKGYVLGLESSILKDAIDAEF